MPKIRHKAVSFLPALIQIEENVRLDSMSIPNSVTLLHSQHLVLFILTHVCSYL